MDVPSFLFGMITSWIVLGVVLRLVYLGYKTGREDERRGVK